MRLFGKRDAGWGAQSRGAIVNVKFAAFNDREINRSGIAVFTSLQAIEAGGKLASLTGGYATEQFTNNSTKFYKKF